MLPAGVDTNTPSETNFLIICLEPCLIDSEAACLLCLSTETSLIAIDFDNAVEAWAKLPVCASVKAGLTIAEY